MMRSRGFEVIHYGNGEDNPGATEHVPIMSEGDLMVYLGKEFHPHSQEFIGNHAVVTSPLYKEWNKRLALALNLSLQEGDAICLPFGHAHQEAVQKCDLVKQRKVVLVETGIGYHVTFAPHRVYESYCWMHYHRGKDGKDGSDTDWVIPNYYDLNEWEVSTQPGNYVLFMGRISDTKGVPIISEIAKRRPDLRFVLCGQGDPKPYLKSNNIEYWPPIHGAQRSKVIGDAQVVLCPSRYVEPFCGVAVEALLCGRPVLTSEFGAFNEHVREVLPYRTHTLRQWLDSLDTLLSIWGPQMSQHLAGFARSRFDMMKVGHQYAQVFDQLQGAFGRGWYEGVD